MRLKYMYYLLKTNYEALENFAIRDDVYRAGNMQYNRGKVVNWRLTRKALINISTVPMVSDFCHFILDNPYFAKIDDSFMIPPEVYRELWSEYRVFLVQIKAVIDFCETVGFSTIENGFDIKMPNTDNFDEFAKNIELLNKSINQCPYLNIDGEKIVLKKTDIGSIWFEFSVITAAGITVLSNLAKIVDKCVKIKSHYISTKQQEENYRAAKLKNDMLETIVEANKQVTGLLLDECIEELKSEIPDVKLDNENTERVKFTLETFSRLMEKGMEIYASVDAPIEVQELFPTSDEITFLPKPKQLLNESNENSDE